MNWFIKSTLAALLLALSITASSAGEIRIAAAASLTHALEEITQLFESQSDHSVKLSFASSGTLTRQIQAGAPFELFLSADADCVETLFQQGITRNIGQNYAKGKLVLFTPQSSKLALSADLSSLEHFHTENPGMKRRFAIANPDLAPYGKIARQALEKAGFWALLSPALITGENASQTARFALSGSVDGALLPLSLALILKAQGKGNFVLISEDLYQPLEQRMVLLKTADQTAKNTANERANETADDFFKFLQQEPARTVFAQHGFTQ